MTECAWFYHCHNESIGVIEHPTIGDVEICSTHVEWLTEMDSPTAWVPPIAARIAKRTGLLERTS